MKVIALKGEKDSGKSTTLKEVYERLKEDGGEQEPDCIKKLGGDPEDIRDVINFAGKKIGIVTQGDYGDEIEKEYKDVSPIELANRPALSVRHHLDILMKEGCDIAICAYRPDLPETEKFLEEYPNPIYLFLQNKSEAEISDNKLTEKATQKAEEIVEFLKKLILHT